MNGFFEFVAGHFDASGIRYDGTEIERLPELVAASADEMFVSSKMTVEESRRSPLAR